MSNGVTRQELDTSLKNVIDNTLVDLNPANLISGQFAGETSMEAMAISCAVYDLLYLSGTGYNKAKADADTTLPCVAMCLVAGTGTQRILKQGYVKNAAWNFTMGQLIYVDPAVAGGLTATKPATIGNRVQVVGQAVNPTTIYFNPQLVWIEI